MAVVGGAGRLTNRLQSEAQFRNRQEIGMRLARKCAERVAQFHLRLVPKQDEGDLR
jgi:hypothetical protein